LEKAVSTIITVFIRPKVQYSLIPY